MLMQHTKIKGDVDAKGPFKMLKFVFGGKERLMLIHPKLKIILALGRKKIKAPKIEPDVEYM